ncbi:hypothetical protein JT359_02485 [Candidatus Poribacteria bacterium]|nr:hypothetical protein [Candidatus Poribacteria bacterium]
MRVFVQIGHGIVGATIISLACIWQAGSYGEARHTISIIGAVAILIAGLYILRSRWIKWGSRKLWLKYHQRLASLGISLVLLHSAFQPLEWHSWLTFTLALSNLGTGVAVSLTAHKTRLILLRCHLILAPILLISIIFHGQAKLDHDEFFPLTNEHDIPCAKCHTSEPFLFKIESSTLQQELDTSEKLPEDIHWWSTQQQVDISQTAIVMIKKMGSEWKISDKENDRDYKIIRQTNQFNLYADNPYRSYTCTSCHVHNTPEIITAHQLHGVNDFNRCLVCHQTEIEGVRYGVQRTNWDYDPNW